MIDVQDNGDGTVDVCMRECGCTEIFETKRKVEEEIKRGILTDYAHERYGFKVEDQIGTWIRDAGNTLWYRREKSE